MAKVAGGDRRSYSRIAPSPQPAATVVGSCGEESRQVTPAGDPTGRTRSQIRRSMSHTRTWVENPMVVKKKGHACERNQIGVGLWVCEVLVGGSGAHACVCCTCGAGHCVTVGTGPAASIRPSVCRQCSTSPAWPVEPGTSLATKEVSPCSLLMKSAATFPHHFEIPSYRE